MKKLAQEIYSCELVHENESSTKEEKARAESRIIQLTNQIMALHDGANIMLEIDNMIQGLVSKQS
jgi:DNA-directed RNA polymerase beta' subunit